MSDPKCVEIFVIERVAAIVDVFIIEGSVKTFERTPK